MKTMLALEHLTYVCVRKKRSNFFLIPDVSIDCYNKEELRWVNSLRWDELNTSVSFYSVSQLISLTGHVDISKAMLYKTIVLEEGIITPRDFAQSLAFDPGSVQWPSSEITVKRINISIFIHLGRDQWWVFKTKP